MPRVSRLVLFALLALIATPGRSSADPIPIRIMDGSLNVTGILGTLSLIGDHGFTFEGPVGATDGVFGPSLSCLPCEPGAPINLLAHWIGNDLRGTATLAGVTYTGVGGLEDDRAFGSVTFTGSTVAPLEGTAATLVAPFSFEGQFSFPTSEPGSFTVATLRGFGTATVVLGRTPDIPWDFKSAVYEFEPIPEPGTMLLVGTALAGLALRRRPRQ